MRERQDRPRVPDCVKLFDVPDTRGQRPCRVADGLRSLGNGKSLDGIRAVAVDRESLRTEVQPEDTFLVAGGIRCEPIDIA